MSKQPEALRLADACDTLGNLLLLVPGLDTFKCAAELRRQHELLQGVTGLLKATRAEHTAFPGALNIRLLMEIDKFLAKAEEQQ